jgi:hypothetical protein
MQRELLWLIGSAAVCYRITVIYSRVTARVPTRFAGGAWTSRALFSFIRLCLSISPVPLRMSQRNLQAIVILRRMRQSSAEKWYRKCWTKSMLIPALQFVQRTIKSQRTDKLLIALLLMKPSPLSHLWKQFIGDGEVRLFRQRRSQLTTSTSRANGLLLGLTANICHCLTISGE